MDYSHLLGTSSSIRLFPFVTNTSDATRVMAFFNKLRAVKYEKLVTTRWSWSNDNERPSDLRLIDERVQLWRQKQSAVLPWSLGIVVTA
jgi:hypothetical protein